MLIRSVIFYPMLWLRGVFLTVAKIIGIIFTVGFLETIIFPRGFILTLLMGLLAFSVFMLRQKYDSILLNLNPTGHELRLWQ